jgi:hypothetical protein
MRGRICGCFDPSIRNASPRFLREWTKNDHPDRFGALENLSWVNENLNRVGRDSLNGAVATRRPDGGPSAMADGGVHRSVSRETETLRNMSPFRPPLAFDLRALSWQISLLSWTSLRQRVNVLSALQLGPDDFLTREDSYASAARTSDKLE